MAYPVAVIQMTVDAGDVEQNRQAATRMTAMAVAQGARLVLFPEACISDIYREAAALAEPIPGPTTETIARVAGDAVIALPLLEKGADGNVYSACALVTSSGVAGVARKTHLYRDSTGHDSFRDADVIAPGAELSLFELGDVRIGVAIGFDAEFPEVFRALSLRGADIVLVAQNGLEPDLRYLSAMAMRNRVPLLVANRIGFRKVYPVVPEFSAASMAILQDKGGAFLMRCRGNSAIIDADGRLLAQPRLNIQTDLDATAGVPFGAAPVAHFQEDEILTSSFRLEDLRVQRLTSPFIAERHEELYTLAKPAPAKKPAAPRKRKS